MRGFVNEGTTCYFNTAIQCLFNTPILSNHFLRKPYTGKCMFTTFYQALTQKYWSFDKKPLDLAPLMLAFQREFPRFKTDEQHDVQEAILCIIDILERAEPIIKEWVYGKKTQETIWPTGKSLNEEIFSVHLMTYKSDDIGKMLKESTDWNTLDNFEDTDGKKHNIATTRMMFSKIPPIFMLSFDVKSHIKIIHEISIDNQTYYLSSCAMHVGNQHDGHYVSFARHKHKWFYMNDEHVSEKTPPDRGSYYFMIYTAKNPP